MCVCVKFLFKTKRLRFGYLVFKLRVAEAAVAVILEISGDEWEAGTACDIMCKLIHLYVFYMLLNKFMYTLYT